MIKDPESKIFLLSKMHFKLFFQNNPTLHHLTNKKQNDFIWNKKKEDIIKNYDMTFKNRGFNISYVL